MKTDLLYDMRNGYLLVMCGIVAYSGKSDSFLKTLLHGLSRLEYRGYDSAGVSISANNSIYSKKAIGKVSILIEAINEDAPSNIGHVGIAHTRWATNGKATIANAHPHCSADGKIWLVHNGIIENYRSIKQALLQKGVSFQGETDSEVIAKLIGDLYKGDLREAVLGATAQLQGTFALCVMSSDEPERLIGAKRSSPLVIGVGSDELIIASDVGAIIDTTSKVIYLNDGELIDIRDGAYSIYDFAGTLHNEPVHAIDWAIETNSKAGFEHYLLKEIMEQPLAVHGSVHGRLHKTSGVVQFEELDGIQERLSTIKQIILVGIGTSYYAAKLGELYFDAFSDMPVMTMMSPEFRYNTLPINEHTWIIAISQSGETADTIAAIEKAKSHGGLVSSIVNVTGSSVSQVSDATIYNHIGPEVSVASTKAFTSQSLLLLMQAVWFSRLRKYDAADNFDILKGLEKLPLAIHGVLEERKKIEEVALSLAQYQHLFYIGRHFNYPVALEGALKIKEIAYMMAEGLSGGELKHGFIALIDKNLPTIAIATNDSVRDKMLVNIEEIKARNGKIIGLANQSHELFDETIIVPDTGSELLQPLVNNVALQLIAYYSAKHRGLNIDQPRNLAKSVTVE
jgi:glucosamine--fructose-6-phosphate aminotransferase (isomerizing)